MKYFCSKQTITKSKDDIEVGQVCYALLERLHIIWVLSKYYCFDNTMYILLEQVSNEVNARIKSTLKPGEVFR